MFLKKHCFFTDLCFSMTTWFSFFRILCIFTEDVGFFPVDSLDKLAFFGDCSIFKEPCYLVYYEARVNCIQADNSFRSPMHFFKKNIYQNMCLQTVRTLTLKYYECRKSFILMSHHYSLVSR